MNSDDWEEEQRRFFEEAAVRPVRSVTPTPGDQWPIGYADLLALLRSRDWPTFAAGERSIKTFCPICEGDGSNSPSLSVSRGRSGQALLHCFNAVFCGLDRTASAEQLAAVIGAFATEPPPVGAGRRYRRRTTGGPDGLGTGKVIEKYEYPDGRTKERIAHGSWTKRFRWVPSGGGEGRQQLYRPPSAEDPEPVFFVEGEKDVERLRFEGLTATTLSEGWLKRSVAEALRGRWVAILADADVHGFYARDVALEVLRGVARAVAWVDLDLPFRQSGGEDVSDWLDAGGTAAELLDLARAAFVR